MSLLPLPLLPLRLPLTPLLLPQPLRPPAPRLPQRSAAVAVPLAAEAAEVAEAAEAAEAATAAIAAAAAKAEVNVGGGIGDEGRAKLESSASSYDVSSKAAPAGLLPQGQPACTPPPLLQLHATAAVPAAGSNVSAALAALAALSTQ